MIWSWLMITFTQNIKSSCPDTTMREALLALKDFSLAPAPDIFYAITDKHTKCSERDWDVFHGWIFFRMPMWGWVSKISFFGEIKQKKLFFHVFWTKNIILSWILDKFHIKSGIFLVKKAFTPIFIRLYTFFKVLANFPENCLFCWSAK